VTIYLRVRRGHRQADSDWVWLGRGRFGNTGLRKMLERRAAEAVYGRDYDLRRGSRRGGRVAIPAHARATFYAGTAGGAAAFAVYGVFSSLMPGFLAGTMHETSYAVAGAVAFAAFASGVVAQIALGKAGIALTLRVSVPVVFAGLALFAAGMWLPSLPLFIVGGIVTGVGNGLVFRGSLVAAAGTAPPESRAEVLAGFYLGAYVGLTVPVIILGVATEYFAAKDVMLFFVVIVAAAIAASTRAVMWPRRAQAAR
jgi:hypothetical protein